MNHFIHFCESLGLIVSCLPPEGTIARVPTVEKPRSKNGALFWEKDFSGRITGWVQNHQTMDKPASYQSQKILSIKDKKEWIKEKTQKEASRRLAEMKAIQRAKDWFHLLPPLKGNHPYLQNKGLSGMGCFGLKTEGTHLVIPIYRDGLISCQKISPDGKEKRFLSGCPTAFGNFLIARKNYSLLCFAEGFATGLAVFQCVPNCAVVVCFNAGNLEPVARLFKEKYESRFKHKKCLICADNDHETEKKTGKNPGLLYAEKAAAVLSCNVAYPKGIKGSDWSDALIEYKDPYRIQMEVLKSLSAM